MQLKTKKKKHLNMVQKREITHKIKEFMNYKMINIPNERSVKHN